jgi:hypothetical protein
MVQEPTQADALTKLQEQDDAGLAQLADQTGLSLRRRETAPTMPGMMGLTSVLSAQRGATKHPSRLETLYTEDGEILTAIIEGAESQADAERQLLAWLKRRRPDAVDLLSEILERAADAGAL